MKRGRNETKGMGFLHPNMLEEEAAVTAGAVLTASGALRIVDPTALNGSHKEADKMSFNQKSEAGGSSGGSQVHRVRRREDTVMVPFANRAWRAAVLDAAPTIHAGDYHGKYDAITKAVPNKANANSTSAADKGFGCSSEPFSLMAAFEEGLVLAEQITCGINEFGGGNTNNGVELSPFELWHKGRQGAAYLAIAAARAASASEKAAAAEATAAAQQLVTEHRTMHFQQDGEENATRGRRRRGTTARDSDDEAKEDFVSLPRLQMPVKTPAPVAPATLPYYTAGTVNSDSSASLLAAGTRQASTRVVMRHLVSGERHFDWVDHDGVMAGAIVPQIASASADKGASVIVDESDDGDGDDEGGDSFDPRSSVNRKFFVKISELEPAVRSQFEMLVAEWKHSVAERHPRPQHRANGEGTAPHDTSAAPPSSATATDPSSRPVGDNVDDLLAEMQAYL